jgi:hypothetical protein
MIPPQAQRALSKRAGSTVVEVKGTHPVYVSQPRAIADLIARAASSVVLATRQRTPNNSNDAWWSHQVAPSDPMLGNPRVVGHGTLPRRGRREFQARRTAELVKRGC